MDPRARLVMIAAAVALALGAFACGGSDDGGGGDGGRGGDAEQIESAYRGIIAAFEKGDAGAMCASMTDSTQRSIRTLSPGSRSCERTFAKLIRIDRTGNKPSPTPTEVDVKVNGARATARIAFADGQPVRVPFAREGGRWKLDGQLDLLR